MKIVWYGDSPTVHTGFGIVSKNLCERLQAKGHEIAIMGINHYGEPYDQRKFPYKIYNVVPGGPAQMYGIERVWDIVRFERPDLLFFLNDPWLIEDSLERKPEDFPYLKMMAYYPTDAGPLKPRWINMLNKFDAQVCYSKYAEKIITESNNNERPKNLYQIYHGVETETFYPMNQQAARLALGLPTDLFIVGMVARNQYRKRFDIMVKSFADFAKDKDNVKLYLHTSVNDVGFDIVDLVRQFDISDKLILTEGVTPAQGVTNERLNLIYNSFDVNCLVSLGDGFGLPVAESMATACPQLVSNHSCLSELVDGHGGLTINNSGWLMHTSGINTWGGLSDPDDLTRKLNLLYHSQDLRIKLSEDAYRFITQPQFSWDYAANEFDKIIRKIFHLL